MFGVQPLYTLFVQDRIERSIGKMWEQKVSNHPSTLPEAALYLRLPDASRLWTWYITWGAWRIHEDSTSSTALRRFTKEAMSSMDAICINIDSGWQRQNLRSGPEALLLSRFININQAVKSSMLSQSKAQQQYANHLRLTRSYKYLSFETQRSSNLAELRSSEIRACHRLTSPHQSEMHRQRNDCSQKFPVEQVLATRHTDSALITALELSQRLLLTFGKVCAAEASLGNQMKVAVPISLHLGRPLTICPK